MSYYALMFFLGGIETVTKERRWAKIANKLGYPSGRSVGSILKNHYERILYPFDVFKQGKTLADIVSYFLFICIITFLPQHCIMHTYNVY